MAGLSLSANLLLQPLWTGVSNDVEMQNRSSTALMCSPVQMTKRVADGGTRCMLAAWRSNLAKRSQHVLSPSPSITSHSPGRNALLPRAAVRG